jgi:formate hydrogenlyase subunit 3/multisubunit Na+/H+ antiporter MnhD subunit
VIGLGLPAAQLAPLIIVLPLLTALLLTSLYRSSRFIGVVAGPFSLLLALALALDLWAQVNLSGPVASAIGNFPAPIGIVLVADSLGVLFVLATLVIALLLWPKGGHDGGREQALVLLLVAAGLGMALSGDIFNLYVFYEILAVASYGLAASRGTGADYAAALRYLVLGAVGSALTLLGIALIYRATGSLNLAHLATVAPEQLADAQALAAFALILIGMAVKAELFPVNTWVPEVYATATGRVSGLLAGVVSKLAVLVVLRTLLTVFADAGGATLLAVLGVLTVVTGELAALRATELRRILAYSSIGQLGLVAVAFSIPGTPGLMAGIALALHHLVVKPALFLLADAWGAGQERGGARRSPWAGFLFVLLALSLVGVPPFPGFWAKLLLLKAALGAGGALLGLAATVVLVAAVIESAYLFRLVGRLYEPGASGHSRVGVRELLPATALAGAVLGAVILVVPAGEALERIAARTADVAAYIQAVFPQFKAVAEVAP